jgi:hypothetical protein
MIKRPAVYYYYAYKSDDGVVLSLPNIPTSQSVEQLKKLYDMYKDNLSGNLKSKQHIIIKSTTSYEQIKEL